MPSLPVHQLSKSRTPANPQIASRTSRDPPMNDEPAYGWTGVIV
jgi:hypothetical protein